MAIIVATACVWSERFGRMLIVHVAKRDYVFAGDLACIALPLSAGADARDVQFLARRCTTRPTQYVSRNNSKNRCRRTDAHKLTSGNYPAPPACIASMVCHTEIPPQHPSNTATVDTVSNNMDTIIRAKDARCKP
jgi:hypothetical protein